MVELWRGELAVRDDDEPPDLSKIEYYSEDYTRALEKIRDLIVAKNDKDVFWTMFWMRGIRYFQALCLVFLAIDAWQGWWWSFLVVLICIPILSVNRQRVWTNHLGRQLGVGGWINQVSHAEEQIALHKMALRRHRAEDS